MSEKFIIDLEINNAEALKNLSDITTQIKQLKDSQDSLDTTTEKGKLKYQQYGQQIEALNANYKSNQAEIQKNIAYQNTEDNSN